MKRRKNSEFPFYLLDTESAINWIMVYDHPSNWMDGFPPNIKSYDQLQEFASDDEGKDLEAFAQANTLLANADAYVELMEVYAGQEEVTLYRMLSIPSGEKLSMDGIGVYWSYDWQCAETHWGDPGKEILLEGLVYPENIDWEGGFLAFLAYGEEECEVRVDKGSPVIIVSIDREAINPPVVAIA